MNKREKAIKSKNHWTLFYLKDIEDSVMIKIKNKLIIFNICFKWVNSEKIITEKLGNLMKPIYLLAKINSIKNLNYISTSKANIIAKTNLYNNILIKPIIKITLLKIKIITNN